MELFTQETVSEMIDQNQIYELGLKQYLENFQCGFFKLENDQIIDLLFIFLQNSQQVPTFKKSG